MMLASSPIIIYGAPRSGTTYLNRILNAHPDVFISHETRIFVWLHQAVNVIAQQDQTLLSEREKFVDLLRSELPDMIRSFYRSLDTTSTYWGDKNPHYAAAENAGCLDTIASLFEETKFIHIIRDGRDVVSSLLRKRTFHGEPWANWNDAHKIWIQHVDTGSHFGATLPCESYLELRYEDLVNDDVTMAHSIFQFLDIDIHEDVIEFCRSQQSHRTPFSGATRDLSRGARSSDWSDIMTPEEQFESLSMLGDHLVRYGYESRDTLAEYRRGSTPTHKNRVGQAPVGSNGAQSDGSEPGSQAPGTGHAGALAIELAARDATIRELRMALDEQVAWAERSAREVKERDAIIGDLQDQVVELTAWARQAVADVDHRDGVIRSLQRQMNEYAEAPHRDAARTGGQRQEGAP